MQIDREKLANLYREANGWSPGAYPITMEELEKFAKRVAEHSASVEREACAKVCDWVAAEWKSDSKTAIDCAAAIRARNNNA